MYADPRHIRDNPIKARFNDDELAVIEALARFNKQQPAVYLRELVLSHIAAAGQQFIETIKAA